MALPVWLLYNKEALVGSVRAHTADEARQLFKRAGMTGTHLRKETTK